MQNVVLIVHVLAAILLLGPVTVAISTFPELTLAARDGEVGTVDTARTMHAVSRTYGIWSLLVPLLGSSVMLADVSTYMESGEMHAAIPLVITAWVLLFFLIIPRQRLVIAGLGVANEDEDTDDPEFIEHRKRAEELDWDKQKSQLTMFSNIFSLLWAVVGILMFFIQGLSSSAWAPHLSALPSYITKLPMRLYVSVRSLGFGNMYASAVF